MPDKDAMREGLKLHETAGPTSRDPRRVDRARPVVLRVKPRIERISSQELPVAFECDSYPIVSEGTWRMVVLRQAGQSITRLTMVTCEGAEANSMQQKHRGTRPAPPRQVLRQVGVSPSEPLEAREFDTPEPIRHWLGEA